MLLYPVALIFAVLVGSFSVHGDNLRAGFLDWKNVEEEVALSATLDQPSQSQPQQQESQYSRLYRTDQAFLSQIAESSLIYASIEAKVPIGAAVGDLDHVLIHEERIFNQTYNMFVTENAMKWPQLLESKDELRIYNFTKADLIVNYAISTGRKVRGHTLIWGKWKGATFPSVVESYVHAATNPNQTIVDIMRRHITTVVSHFCGRVDAWDVINEHLTHRWQQNIFFKTLGDDYVKMAFQLAREAIIANTNTKPNTRLVWNENICNFNLDDRHIQKWLELLQQYKSEGVPIDTIGIQGHNAKRLHNIAELSTFLQTVVDMGYDVELTEVDASIQLFRKYDDPFQAQAEFIKEYALACLNTGKCKGITFWGLTDKYTWYDTVFSEDVPNLPLLIDEEGNQKPAWLGVRQALESSFMH